MKLATIVLLALVLAGCGGGGGSATAPQPPAPPPATPSSPPRCDALRVMLPDAVQATAIDVSLPNPDEPCLFASTLFGATAHSEIIQPALANARAEYPEFTGKQPPSLAGQLILVRFSVLLDPESGRNCVRAPDEDWIGLDANLAVFGPAHEVQGHMCAAGYTQPMPLAFPTTITVPENARPDGQWLDYEFMNAMCRIEHPDWNTCVASGLLSYKPPAAPR